MSINLLLHSSLELLNTGFELDLYAMHEHSMVFGQLKYHYQLLTMNRKSILIGIEDASKAGYLNLEDLSSSSEAFRERRRKFTTLQKLMCD
jgi:hypothetical protein